MVTDRNGNKWCVSRFSRLLKPEQILFISKNCRRYEKFEKKINMYAIAPFAKFFFVLLVNIIDDSSISQSETPAAKTADNINWNWQWYCLNIKLVTASGQMLWWWIGNVMGVMGVAVVHVVYWNLHAIWERYDPMWRCNGTEMKLHRNINKSANQDIGIEFSREFDSLRQAEIGEWQR